MLNLKRHSDFHPESNIQKLLKLRNVFIEKIFFFFLLNFQVKLVFNKSVSWVRVRDDHILTVDRITFIADERFHAFYAAETVGLHQQQQQSRFVHFFFLGFLGGLRTYSASSVRF